MRKLEVFFDYACPYCLRGHEYLKQLMGSFSDIQIEWRPCEAHPRPERGPHSDICMQGMYYALEYGADIWAYHDLMFLACRRTCHKERIDIEDIDALAQYAAGLLNQEDFRQALARGTYAERQRQGNDYAYETSGVWALPSYRMGGRKLDAQEGVGVPMDKLQEFLKER
jgi:predicted DsbA family dithiol-disulfide isomerase